MVDADRLLSILARLTARLRVLDEYADQDPDDLLSDRVRMGDLKYTFQTALEACIDAAHHIVASDGLGEPSSNADAFRLLASAGVLDGELAESLVGAVGFRNVLVHGYADVDDGQVVLNLARRDDLRAMVRALTSLLDQDDR